MKEFCVYTGLFGSYEKLNEQPVQKDSEIDFICFTDDKHLKSKTWEIIYVEPPFPMDHIRSARTIKITPHRYLPNYSTSLYIDNAVKLKKPPKEIFHQTMSKEYDLYCVRHSYRDSVFDEFEKVLSLGFDNADKIIEQFNIYNMLDPDMFFERPFWSGFLIRNHNKEVITKMMDDWLGQVLRYSRRDQLSLNFEIRKFGIDVKVLEIDNNSSHIHEWPTAERYGKQAISLSVKKSLQTIVASPPKTELSNVIEDFEELEQLYNTKKKELIELEILFAKNKSDLEELEKLYAECKSDLDKLEKMYAKCKSDLDESKHLNTKNRTEIERLNLERKIITNLIIQMEQLQAEVEFYTNSKSWRITRPLRKLMKLIKR